MHLNYCVFMALAYLKLIRSNARDINFFIKFFTNWWCGVVISKNDVNGGLDENQ